MSSLEVFLLLVKIFQIFLDFVLIHVAVTAVIVVVLVVDNVKEKKKNERIL